MHCNDTDVKKNTSNKEIFCTRIVLINVASDKCRHSIADKQADRLKSHERRPEVDRLDGR